MHRTRLVLLLAVLASGLLPGNVSAADPLDVSFEVVRVTPSSATIRATIQGATGPLNVTARVDPYRGKQGPAVQGLRIQSVDRVAYYVHTPEYETVRTPIDEAIAALEAEVAALEKAPVEKGDDPKLQEEVIDGKEDELAALYAEKDLGAAFYETQEVVAHRYDLRYRERLAPVASASVNDTLLLSGQSWAEPPPSKVLSDTELTLGETTVGWGGDMVYEYTVATDTLYSEKTGWSTSGILVLTIDGQDYYDDRNSSWWNETWPYRMKLTIDNSASTENLIDFPLMVKLTPERFEYSFAQVDGDDVRFVDADGTALDYECDTWELDGDSWFWVRVPQIDALSTTDYIWLYFGTPTAANGENAEGVWPTDTWAAVYHMNDAPGDPTRILDSTSNANHGTKGAGDAAPTEVGGLVGRAQQFGGAQYVVIPQALSAALVGQGAATVTTLVQQANVTAQQWYLRIRNASNSGRFDVNALVGGRIQVVGRTATESGQSFNSLLTVTPTQWDVISAIISPATQRNHCIVNGVSETSAALSYANAAWQSSLSGADYIGTSGGSGWLTGLIDELWLSSVALSPDEHAAIDASLRDSMLDYGDPQGNAELPEPLENWGGAVVLLLVTFIAMKERHVMVYAAAFLVLATYGFAIGAENIGLSIATLCFSGFMVYSIAQSFAPRRE